MVRAQLHGILGDVQFGTESQKCKTLESLRSESLVLICV
jgi:hypothetical protein